MVFGCDSGGDVSNGVTGPGDLSGNAFAVVGAEDQIANVQDATMTNEMTMPPALGGPGAFRRHHNHPGNPGSHLGFVLRSLELSEEQVEAVRAILMDHRAKITPILERFREINQPLIEQANQERRRILGAVRDEEITPEEARQMLRELSLRVRGEIRSNPANQAIHEELCDAKRETFDEIRAILDDEQQEKWDRWVEALGGPCLGD
jgi:hypothetical protein